MARISDQPAKNSLDSTDLFVIEDTEHAGFKVAFSNLLASITQLASLTINTLFHVNGDTELGDTEINGDLEVNGDIIQNGQAYETHAEKVYTKNDTMFLRDGAVSGLPTGKYAGFVAKHYDQDGHDGALVFDKTGEARVGDYTETDVTVYSPDGENFYTDSEMTEAATIPAGVTPELVSGIEYKYTAADDDTEPLLTRDEAAGLTNGEYLKWNATSRKAVAGLKIPDPVINNTVLTAKIAAGGAVSCEWTSVGNGSGVPVGTIIAMFKKSNPANYLYLDGRDTTGTSEELETHYPLLYAYLDNSNVLPDYREFALVGAEENTTDVYNASTNPTGTIHDHDVYTEGQAKDDCIQDFNMNISTEGTNYNRLTKGSNTQVGTAKISEISSEARTGTTTHGKRKAVYFYIKAA